MDRNFERALSLVLKHEGGWSDHPKDPGGATMKGVTLANFRRYIKPNATKEDLRRITDEQVATIYRRYYWDAVAGAELPGGIDYAVFDFAVNSGPARAAKYLQAVVGAKQDGKIGPATLRATRAMVRATVINDLCDRRMDFLRRLSTWGTFGKGWTSRVSGVRAEALKMAAMPDVPPPVVKEVEKPVVPPAVEQEVQKAERRNWWQWLLALPLAGVGSFFRDYPEVAWAATGGVVVLAVVALIGGRGFVRRVKDIADEVRS